MKKLKILFVDHTPFAGGAQLCLARDIKYLDRNKFEPSLLIDQGSEAESIYRDSNVKIFKIPFGKFKKLNPSVIREVYNSVGKLNQLIAEIKPDLVLANTTRALIITSLSKKKFKLVSYIRDYDYPKWLMGLVARKVDKFLTVSKSVSNFYGFRKPKAEVIYLGAEVKAVGGGQKAEGITVGFVGRLVVWKGPIFLLDAFIRANIPNSKLLFFGSGEGQPGDVESNLKLKISNLKLGKQVKLMGFVGDLGEVFEQIDCLVLPSLKPEPFATNVIEAALMKKPIIATNIGGTPEFIKNGKNGILIDPNDTAQLAKALVDLSQDKKLAARLANQAFADAQDFKEEKFIKRLEKTFESCINT